MRWCRVSRRDLAAGRTCLRANVGVFSHETSCHRLQAPQATKEPSYGSILSRKPPASVRSRRTRKPSRQPRAASPFEIVGKASSLSLTSTDESAADDDDGGNETVRSFTHDSFLLQEQGPAHSETPDTASLADANSPHKWGQSKGAEPSSVTSADGASASGITTKGTPEDSSEWGEGVSIGAEGVTDEEWWLMGPEEQARFLFKPPQQSTSLLRELDETWEEQLLSAVLELDSAVESQILRPIQMDAMDLEEQVLHQWVVSRRRELYPRHPYLLAYEWRAGNNAIFFQGDLLLWDGSTEILSVEVKSMKSPAGSDQIVENLRHRKVESQAQKGEVFALHFMAEKPQPLALRLALMITGELPNALGTSVTNHFVERHHPNLSEQQRQMLHETFRLFRSQATVLTPAVRVPEAGHSLPQARKNGPARRLPSLDPLSADDSDEVADDFEYANCSPMDLSDVRAEEQVLNPKTAEDVCMAIVHVLCKFDNNSCGTSRLANELFAMFGRRSFRKVTGQNLGSFLQAHCSLFLATHNQGQFLISLPQKLNGIVKKRALKFDDLRPYVNHKQALHPHSNLYP